MKISSGQVWLGMMLLGFGWIVASSSKADGILHLFKPKEFRTKAGLNREELRESRQERLAFEDFRLLEPYVATILDSRAILWTGGLNSYGRAGVLGGLIELNDYAPESGGTEHIGVRWPEFSFELYFDNLDVKPVQFSLELWGDDLLVDDFSESLRSLVVQSLKSGGSRFDWRSVSVLVSSENGKLSKIVFEGDWNPEFIWEDIEPCSEGEKDFYANAYLKAASWLCFDYLDLKGGVYFCAPRLTFSELPIWGGGEFLLIKRGSEISKVYVQAKLEQGKKVVLLREAFSEEQGNPVQYEVRPHTTKGGVTVDLALGRLHATVPLDEIPDAKMGFDLGRRR